MKYLQEGVGEITKEAFEAILGPHVKVVQPTATEGYVATVDALEVTQYDASTSSIVYLNVGPPSWLGVRRQNAGDLVIKDWKHEGGKHFCPVEIGGGKYDAGAGQVGPFTLSLVTTEPGYVCSFVVSGIGWKAGTNHQHANIYATLKYLEGPVEPPPVEPPPVEPSPEPPPEPLTEVKALILAAKAQLAEAQLSLDRALELL